VGHQVGESEEECYAVHHPPRQWSATCPFEFVNLVHSWEAFSISVHFDLILTDSGFRATNFGKPPAEGVRFYLRERRVLWQQDSLRWRQHG
jgi:hypothetical protein